MTGLRVLGSGFEGLRRGLGVKGLGLGFEGLRV